jgi:F-type H+-transporting ATPase subunit alpha
LKQPQYSPLSVAEQVALVYAGLNGYLDDLPVDKVTGYTAALREYLKTSKPAYAQTIKDNKMQLTDEAEALLKEAIAECKKSFLAAA